MRHQKTTAAILFVGIALLSGIFSAQTQAAGRAPAAQVKQGLYEIVNQTDTDFVLDVRHCTAADTDSHALQLYRPLEVNQQKFYVEDLNGPACRISVLCSGEALTASGDGGAVSMALLEQPETQQAAGPQSWIFREAGDGSYYIESRGGKYLTLDASLGYCGASVSLSDFSGEESQRWLLRSTLISAEQTADTDLVNPYGEDGPYRGLRLSLQFGIGYEVLSGADLAAHVSETEEHRMELDPEFLSSYLEQLAQKYDTQGYPRNFMTSYGIPITLQMGDFGWKLNVEGTCAMLSEHLKSAGSEILFPVWSHKGTTFERGNDIGDSYVEVDLENQKVFLYKNGRKLMETDCVSGTYGTDRQTPGGVYSIYYMQSPDVLEGPGYSDPVEYWMAFNGGIGLHDANWRSEFGGDIYLTNGSHGCVNLPTRAAEQLYHTVEIGYPVVCYQ